MHFSKLTQISLVIVLALQIAILSGCDQYDELTNDPPKITSFTVPGEVPYGETVRFKARAFDPEDDTLTYVWDVSKGTLIVDTGPEVQWTAPELPPEEIVPPTTVAVSVSVQDGGEEEVHKSASVIIFSKPYRIAQVLSGTYELVSKQVHGDPVEETGVLRLTISTFTREFQDEAQGPVQYSSGTYKLVAPFDQSTGTIHWFVDGNPTPLTGTYTWDGRLLVLFMRATATRYVYSIIGEDTGDITVDDPKDIAPEPVNTDPVPVDDGIDPEPIADDPIEVVDDVVPEPIADDPIEVVDDVVPEPVADEPIEIVDDVVPEPVDVVPEEDVDPVLINADGKIVEITDATFKTEVLDAKAPVVLEFAADWCPFCRQMMPVVETVALEHRNTFIVGRLDIDANPRTPGEYKVNGIPTYIIFQDGKVVGKMVGVMPKTVFAEKILDALK